MHPIKNKIIALAFLALLPAAAQAKKIPKLNLVTDNPFFSPNRDGSNDQLVFKTEIEKIKAVAWELKLQDASAVSRKTFSGTDQIPETISWDGLDDFGAPCPEGSYEVFFKAWDKKSQMYSAPSSRIVLDLTPPTLSLNTDFKYVLIKDDLPQPVTFYFSAVDLSGIGSWKMDILTKNHQEIFSTASADPLPSTWVWIPEKEKLGSETVTAILSLIDKAGNKGDSPPFDLGIQSKISAKTQSAPALKTPVFQPKVKTQSKTVSEQEPPAEKKANELQGPFLQLTSIMSVSDLFGNNADNQSALSEQSVVLLEPLAKALLDSPGSRAIILGHVDTKPTPQEAKALSSYFAWRVYSYFVKQRGCDKTSVSVKGLGADVPIAENRTLLGRSRNRRIEIQMFFPVNR